MIKLEVLIIESDEDLRKRVVAEILKIDPRMEIIQVKTIDDVSKLLDQSGPFTILRKLEQIEANMGRAEAVCQQITDSLDKTSCAAPDDVRKSCQWHVGTALAEV